MAGIIKCNTGTLATDQGDVTYNLNEIKKSLETLDAISRGLGSMWAGDAADAYKLKLDGYIDELRKVCTRVESIVAYEGKAVEEYDQCGAAISGIIASIDI